MEKEQDFNELLQEVQQQFLTYGEESNKRFQELEDLISLAVQKMEILEKRQYRKVLNQETSQNSPHYQLNTPKYDEYPGEDKEDWHSEEIICRALGLEEFFQPKITKEENYGGAKELECTYDFRITPRKIKSNDKEQDVPDDQSKELHKLKRKVYVVQFEDSADLRDQDIQKSNGEVDRILSKMNQQTVVPMGAGLKVLPFRYQYMVLEQNRPEINKTTEGYEVSRINVTIHIFDPGGDQYTSYKVETVMQTALLHKNLYLAVEQGRRTFMRT